MKLVNPWRKETAEWIKPDTTVYAVFLTSNTFPDGLMGDKAYLSEDDAKSHHWIRRPSKREKETVEIKSMPFSEYLTEHLKERGMNPFFDLGRLEFLSAYNAKNI